MYRLNGNILGTFNRPFRSTRAVEANYAPVRVSSDDEVASDPWTRWNASASEKLGKLTTKKFSSRFHGAHIHILPSPGSWDVFFLGVDAGPLHCRIRRWLRRAIATPSGCQTNSLAGQHTLCLGAVARLWPCQAPQRSVCHAGQLT